MSVKTVAGYTIACDWPGCEVTADDDGDYAFWTEIEHAWLTAENADGRVGHGEHEWYCAEHPAAWSSDHEEGESYPAAPFLLIHDGMKGYEGGRVTLVEHLHAGMPCLPDTACPTAAAAAEAQQYDALIEVPR